MMPAARKQAPPEDWTPPRVTIVVAGTARTGSTWLGGMMARTGVLGWPREYFNARNQRLLEEGIAGDAVVRCRAVRDIGMTPNGVAGIKMFPEHFDWLSNRVRLTEWFPSIAWIWLRRRDLVAQAVSRTILRRNDLAPDAPPPIPEIDRHLADLAGQEGRWRTYFARNAIRPVELWYEDIIADPADAVSRIANAAGVDAAGLTVDPGPRPAGDPLPAAWRAAFVQQTGSRDTLR